MEQKISSSIIPFKQTKSMRSKNRSFRKRNISDSSEDIPKKKNKKKNELTTEIFVKKKAKKKMDLISVNMKRDRLNLNNPSEFYADLFSNFVVNNPQINESGISNIPRIKISRYEET